MSRRCDRIAFVRDVYGWDDGSLSRLCEISTVWSDVRSAQGLDEEAKKARGVLANRYARAFYHACKAAGLNEHDAKDATQDFLVKLIDGSLLARVRADRGSFRAFLKAALRNLLTDRWRSAALHRTVPLEEDSAVDPYAGPEAVLEEGWLRELLLEVHRRTEARLEEGSLAHRLNDWVRRDWEGFHALSQVKIAERLGVERGKVRYAMERLSAVVTEELSRLVTAEVASSADFAEESRWLHARLNATPPRR